MMPNAGLRSERGYTLIEMMAAVMVIGLLASMAALQIGSVRPAMQADAAMRSVIAHLTFARETAVSQRRRVAIEWDTATSVLRVVRQDLPSGTTVLREVGFESGVRFGQVTAAAPETGFPTTGAVSFTATPVFFTTDGSLVDEGGAPVNGSIYLMIPDMANTGRAVTVLGTIGRLRGYRWNGTRWTRA